VSWSEWPDRAAAKALTVIAHPVPPTSDEDRSHPLGVLVGALRAGVRSHGRVHAVAPEPCWTTRSPRDPAKAKPRGRTRSHR
jgi:hypothetical protein